VKTSENGYIWRHVSHRNLLIPRNTNKTKEDVTFPVETEVIHPYLTENDIPSYVIGYTRAVIDFTPIKIKYMSLICEAAVIAANNFHDENEDDAELDNKIFKPRELTAYGSSLNLADLNDEEALEMGCWSTHGTRKLGGSHNPDVPEPEFGIPPTWEPVDAYSFPVADIPAASLIPDNLTFEHFHDLKHLADGSNSNVYTAKYKGEQVIVKIITEKAKTNKVAVHEFDVEHGMLARFNHPHIIRLLGAGRHPRRFIVLEYLGGGSLNSVLGEREKKTGLANKFFKKSTFTYGTLLNMAKDIADAFHYLHTNVHEGCTVIHRDIKPDNIGFTSDGEVKLFDFGLCTCVKKRSTANECYEMTGNTGSLRYMAPEVAMRQPYNEKTDVYSFGILLWQMAKDKTPFKGMNRNDFMNRVVKKGERPKIDKSWTPEFVQLLESCWHQDQSQRPTFEMICHTLTRLIMTAEGKNTNRRSSLSKSQTQSTWF
jgi:tRNA A-37 threonylcarbamoyl transferase component Bud32